jgi:DNA-directed RNA polymerase I subunit RPA49
VLSGLLNNFAQKSGKRFSITDKMRTKILSWICALTLVLDAGVTDVGRTAKDLSMTDMK